jgi:hypothetical protein
MTNPRVTPDELALRIMLSDAPAAERARQLQALRAQLSVSTGQQCPECAGTAIEDNGASGSQLAFLCEGCGHQWDAVEV